MPVSRLKKTVGDLTLHFFVTIIVALVVYVDSPNLRNIFFLALGGIFVDLDHLIDYFLFYKHRFELKKFLNCSYLDSGKVYVFLHSWEIILFIGILGFLLRSIELTMLSLGFALHLSIDNLQRKNRFCYILSYRMIKEFDMETLLPEYIQSDF